MATLPKGLAKMGLRISDALKLSWSNILGYKKRSAIIVLTVSLLFGLILCLNLVSSGIKETLIQASAGQTDEEIYVKVKYGATSRTSSHAVSTFDEIKQADLEPFVDEVADQKIRERAEAYDGEIVGYVWEYSIGYPYRVITKTAVEPFINNVLWEGLPEDKVPVIMPEDWELPASQGADWLRDQIGDTLYRVGSVSGTKTGPPTIAGFNALNIILTQLPSNANDVFWLVDDGSGKILSYIKNQLETYLSSRPTAFYNLSPIEKTAVVRFDDPKKMIEFTDLDAEMLGGNKFTAPDSYYSAEDLFGTTVNVVRAFNAWEILLMTVGVLLLVVAILIATTTFAHLIDQEVATVALYRAMGASVRDIYLIYFLYLIKLCCLAIIAAVIVAFLFLGLVALTSTNTLSEHLGTFYNLDYLPKVTLCKPNEASFIILVAILLVAPPSLMFNLNRFSAKHIAKKLKED